MSWQTVLKKKPLVGGQKELDKDKDGDIDGEDFELMNKFSLFGKKPEKPSLFGKLNTEEEIEKNIMANVKGRMSNLADKVAPQRVENRRIQAKNDAQMQVSRQREQAYPQMAKQLFTQWVNSSPKSWPNGEPLISTADMMRQRRNEMAGTTDNTPNEVVKPENNQLTMTQWTMKGGQGEVFSELKRKFPDPAEAQYMNKMDWQEVIKFGYSQRQLQQLDETKFKQLLNKINTRVKNPAPINVRDGYLRVTANNKVYKELQQMASKLGKDIKQELLALHPEYKDIEIKQNALMGVTMHFKK